MNIQKLFEMQKQLDLRIEQQHPRQEGEDRLAKKILALLVELGELANEWKIFKYWKVNPKSNVSKFTTCSNEEAEHYFCVTCHHNYSVEKAVDMDFVCPTDDNDLMPMKQVNPMLEEYVDCLHFILSIGLDIGICPEEVDTDPYYCVNVTEQFIDTFWIVSQFRYEEQNGRLYEDYLIYDNMIGHFIGLGEMIGFTWDEVEQAYTSKNAVNHERQRSGY